VFGGGVNDPGQGAVGAEEGNGQDSCLRVRDGRGFNRKENVGVTPGAPGLLSPRLVGVTRNVSVGGGSHDPKGSDHGLVTGKDVVRSRRALHLQALAGTDALPDAGPEGTFRLRNVTRQETPAGIQAIEGIPVESRVGLKVRGGGFAEELVEL
jgi:hypothetical protein